MKRGVAYTVGYAIGVAVSLALGLLTVAYNGREVVIRGKNGGPVIRQSVVLHLVPKESS